MKEMLQKSFMKNKSSYIAAAACLTVFLVLLLFPYKPKATRVNLSEYSSVNSICELATLKSFYHNVAIYEKEPEGGNKIVNDILFWPFGGYTKVGYKQFWMEYSGIVETGIDANQITISEPDSNGIVNVYIPEAKVLSVYADENSLTEPLSENGWFTTISGKEKTEAFSAAQSAMRQEAENDQVLLRRSKENAKVLIEKYIINTGNEMGLDLTINWTDAP